MLKIKWDILGKRKWISPTTIDDKKTHHPLYSRWKEMNNRCHNIHHKRYCDYGGRGIYVCESWKTSYDDFYTWGVNNGYDQSLQLDRIDNSVGYSPNNCRWTTAKNNNLNKRAYGKIKYHGVGLKEKYNRYYAHIKINGNTTHIGYYDTPHQAALAYNTYIITNNLPNTINILGDI